MTKRRFRDANGNEFELPVDYFIGGVSVSLSVDADGTETVTYYNPCHCVVDHVPDADCKTCNGEGVRWRGEGTNQKDDA